MPEPNYLRHDLKETKIKLCFLEQNAASSDIQMDVIVEQIESFQSELRVVKVERDRLKTVVEQHACAFSSDKSRCKGSHTVADVSLGYMSVATNVLSKLSACCSKKKLWIYVFSLPFYYKNCLVVPALLRVSVSLPTCLLLRIVPVMLCEPLGDITLHLSNATWISWTGRTGRLGGESRLCLSQNNCIWLGKAHLCRIHHHQQKNERESATITFLWT